MGKIFYIMGKSSSGKDTVYERLLAREELGLRRVIMYTTRPIRSNETDGVQYHFVSIDQMEQMNADGKVIELRRYDTIAGPWYYFTADSQHMNLEQHNYLALGTLESFVKMQRYYGKDRVVPIYMEVEDGLRLERALSRERQLLEPRYEEMCRRFLADQKDFTEEKIQEAGIARRFSNNGSLDVCMDEIMSFISENLDK